MSEGNWTQVDPTKIGFEYLDTHNIANFHPRFPGVHLSYSDDYNVCKELNAIPNTEKLVLYMPKLYVPNGYTIQQGGL